MAGPHQDQPLATAGTDPADADAGAVMVHGRGASARGILGMAGEFGVEGVAYVAPQARRGTWYPNSFTAPMDSNEPGLSSGLRAVADAVETLNDAGIPTDRVLLLGFSQGACLASEFVARNARRYGGLAAYSGGVIGPEGTPRDYEGSLDGTPVFLGCSDRDPHIPLERVHETAAVFEELGGNVTERIYEGMGHTVNEDEIEFVADMLADLVD
ncbi:dienelactone hydrolase family protein [Halorussus salilacus]|uniref:alpha/beta hydrolase n=1 Tax=Halorussus salilacus TaxID=2953750 RepID=UPI0020A0E9C0|nr:dienelactone hydrolase family protein [Halorussus salilacus]USZ67827.1 dienelactone hydrolase family protein [Halorussus salilacus]